MTMTTTTATATTTTATTASGTTQAVTRQLSSYALGLVFIFVVAIIWALASILVQYLYNDTSFDAPFVLTYMGTSLFTVLLPMHWLYDQWKQYPWQERRHGHGGASWERIHSSDVSEEENVGLEGDDENERVATARNQQPSSQTQHPRSPHSDNDSNDVSHHWTHRDHMVAAAKIAPMWFISNFAYNASLRYTSITSSTVLVNTGSLFTFLFAVLMRDEHFSWWKVLGVACGISGSMLTGMHDWDGNNNSGSRLLRWLSSDADNNQDDDNDESLLIWGDVLSLISAVFYGVYAVMVRVLCPHDESLMSMQLFLGYVGMWNMICLSPIAIWQLTGDNAASLTLWIFECLVIKGLLDNVLSDYLWARAVVLTSATVATVGLGLTIPLAFVSDVFLGRADVLNWQSVTGAVAVLTGFALVNMGQRRDDAEEEVLHLPQRPAEPDSDRQQQLGYQEETVPFHPFSQELSSFDAGQQQVLHQQQIPDLALVHHMSMDNTSASGRYKDDSIVESSD